MKKLIPAAIALILLLAPRLAQAHQLEFGLFEVREAEPGIFNVLFRYSGSEHAPVAGEPTLPAHCKAVGMITDNMTSNGMSARWKADCGEQGLEGSEISVAGITQTHAQVLLRVIGADGQVHEAMLDAKHPAEMIGGEKPEASSVGLQYGSLGVEHILTGIDHLLFVLALVLLVGGGRRLLATITAFTLGHSITLALSALDIVRVASAPTEALIALSILLAGVELLRDPDAPKTLTQRYPGLISATFGLFHGLGFAGALREIGLPQGEIPMALLSFNVGVELGQLLFIGALIPLLALGRQFAGERAPVITRWGAFALGSVASFWFWERVAATFA